jgi:hypothetical protein
MARSGHREMARTPDAARAAAVLDLTCLPPALKEAPMPLIKARLIENVFGTAPKEE